MDFDDDEEEEDDDDLLNSIEEENIDYKDAEELDSQNLKIKNKIRRGEKNFFKLENPVKKVKIID